jgi:hypothetical protein
MRRMRSSSKTIAAATVVILLSGCVASSSRVFTCNPFCKQDEHGVWRDQQGQPCHTIRGSDARLCDDIREAAEASDRFN